MAVYFTRFSFPNNVLYSEQRSSIKRIEFTSFTRFMQMKKLIPSNSSFVDHLCYLCLVFVMLSRLFIAALWLLAGKRLTSWLLSVSFDCVLSLSHVVSWVTCGT